MSDGEAHASHLAAQTLANMVIARRAAYLDRSGLRPQIQRDLMALSIETSKLFAKKVQEAELWDADEVDQRKAFLKPSSSGYLKQQTSAKGKGHAMGKLSASAYQAKQTKPKPPPWLLQARRWLLVPGQAPSSLVYEPVGGRLADFISQWLLAKEDIYILRRARIQLEFLPRPPLAKSPILISRNAKREAELCGGDGQQGGPWTGAATISRLYSNLFLVPKRSEGLRPVINLNLFIKKEKFKMETTTSIWKALSPGDWVTSIDLKDAYFHIPVHPNYQKCFRIVVGGNVFQFKALPFGLSPAPRDICG